MGRLTEERMVKWGRWLNGWMDGQKDALTIGRMTVTDARGTETQTGG